MLIVLICKCEFDSFMGLEKDHFLDGYNILISLYFSLFFKKGDRIKKAHNRMMSICGLSILLILMNLRLVDYELEVYINPNPVTATIDGVI